jgi:hypothetical protein
MKQIHNKRRQRLAISILDANGKPQERVLKPHEKTEPIPENKIGAYTHSLAQKGHVRIRNVV